MARGSGKMGRIHAGAVVCVVALAACGGGAGDGACGRALLADLAVGEAAARAVPGLAGVDVAESGRGAPARVGGRYHTTYALQGAVAGPVSPDWQGELAAAVQAEIERRGGRVTEIGGGTGGVGLGYVTRCADGWVDVVGTVAADTLHGWVSVTEVPRPR